MNLTETKNKIKLTYVQFGEVGEDLAEAVVTVLLRELDFAHVEVSDAVDLVVFVHHGGGFPLRFG